MTELIIHIPAQKEALVKELIEQLGGNVSYKKEKKTPSKKGKQRGIDHTYLFGKWKHFDVDAQKLRDELWSRG